MQFGFYTGHENGCGHPNDCPHLGGTAVGMLVQIASTGESSRLYIHRQLDAERKRNSGWVAEVVRLEDALEQARLELRLERQNKFETKKQKSEDPETEQASNEKATGKRGAPVGHAGWYRKTPAEYDVRVDVSAPNRCHHCQANNVSVYASQKSRNICRKTLSMAGTTSRCSLICQHRVRTRNRRTVLTPSESATTA